MTPAAEALREAVLFGAFLIGSPLALAAVFGGLCWVINQLRRRKVN